jgi:hypothetical protein
MKIRKRQRGQSMVEFGLLALLFTLILFGIADFGMLLNGWVAVSSSAREAARHASVGDKIDPIADSARNFAPVPGVRPSQVKVVIQYCTNTDPQCAAPVRTWCSGGTPPPQYGFMCTVGWDASWPVSPPMGPPPGYTAKVTVIADTFEVITPLVRPIFGCDGSVPHCWVPIVSSTAMRFEGAPPP